MMHALVPCIGCRRHVQLAETSCPFCGHALSGHARRIAPDTPRRLGRAAAFVFGATVALGGCEDTVVIDDDDNAATSTTASGTGGDGGASHALYGGPAVGGGGAGGDGGGMQALYGAPPVGGGGAGEGGFMAEYGAPPPPDD
jgi:hypothetical protein